MPAPGVDTGGEERASYLLGWRNGENVTQRSLLRCSRARKKAPGGRECQKVVGEPAPAWRAASMTQGTPPAGPDTVNLYHVVHPSFTAHCRMGVRVRSLTPNGGVTRRSR